MKRNIVITMIGLIFMFGLWVNVNAEMAKQGEGTFKAFWVGTNRVLPMEKERLEYQNEAVGIIDTSENSPFYNATAYNLETGHSVKGVAKASGFTRYTRPDGDLIFGTYELTRNSQTGESKGKLTFVGGTGKCSGITGTWEINGGPPLRPPQSPYGASTTFGKYNWKIP